MLVSCFCYKSIAQTIYLNAKLLMPPCALLLFFNLVARLPILYSIFVSVSSMSNREEKKLGKYCKYTIGNQGTVINCSAPFHRQR